MCDKINKSILIAVCFSIISCFLPALSSARVVVQTEVVSGNIAQKYENHAIKLDNGKIYEPARKGLSVDLSVGEPVTLRIVEQADKDIFFEFAPGLNSLKGQKDIHPKENNSPK